MEPGERDAELLLGEALAASSKIKVLHDDEGPPPASGQRPGVQGLRDDEGGARGRGGGSERGQARGLGLKHPVVAPQRRLDEVGPAGLGLVLVGRGPGGAGDELLGRDAFAELGLKPRGGGGQSTGRGRGGR